MSYAITLVFFGAAFFGAALRSLVAAEGGWG